MLADLIRIVRPDAVVVNLPTVERGQAVADAVELCIRLRRCGASSTWPTDRA